MKSIYLFGILFFILIIEIQAQNCTIICSGGSPCTIDWDNLECDETGSSPAVGDEIIITDGVTVEVTDSNESFDGSIRIESGGLLDFPSSSDKLDLTNGSSGCGNYIIIESGGKVTGSSASNQLGICGETIGKGGGGCTDDPADPPTTSDDPPYCLDGDGLNGEVALDENGVNPGILPIELVSFSGKLQNGGVLLNWVTASEINFSHFELHYSTDGYQFQKIAQIEGKNLLDGWNQYSFLHTSVINGNNYYRLKNVDIDSTYSYSKVIEVSLKKSGEMEIYPTYNNQGGQIYAHFPESESKADILFYSLSGKLIYSERIEDISKGTIQITPKIRLNPNNYIVEIKTGKKRLSMPIIVVD